jgi:hypothetical protein
LKTILNSIDDTKISKKQAVNEYKKLTITSPIKWIVQKVFINKWQQVNPWIKLFSIINNEKPQIRVFFSKNELKFLKENMDIFVESDWKKLKAKLISFSNIADNNLKYTWIIKILDKNNSFWEILKIRIPIESKIILVDLKLVSLSNQEWFWKIKILNKDWKIELEEVKLWKIFSNKIEILWCKNTKIDCNNLSLIIE